MLATRTMGKLELAWLATIWTTVVWIGSDMYLPAMPTLDETFPVSEALVNATLLAFNIAMPLGSILGGAVSDRLGRRGPTLFGGALYLAASLVCAAAPSIGVLIAARVVEGFGGGIVCATTMAILKDCLAGEDLRQAITISQSFVAVGPVAAPFLGSLMLDVIGWRGIFWLIAGLSAACLVWVATLAEPLAPERRSSMGVLRSLGLVAKVARRPDFSLVLVALSMPALSFGVFMTLCSYIYIDFFGLSNLGYSVCYGITTGIAMVGPVCYVALDRRFGTKSAAGLILAMLAFAGALILTVGGGSAGAMLACCVPFVLAESMMRPCAYLALLGTADDSAGSVSALINFSIGVAMGLGTPIASLGCWPNHVVAFGAPVLIAGLLALGIVLVVTRVMKSKVLG